MQTTGNFALDMIIDTLGLMMFHELGHYIAFLLCGIRPKVVVQYGTIGILAPLGLFKLNPLQDILCAIAGIASGVVYAVWFVPYDQRFFFITLAFLAGYIDMSEIHELIYSICKYPNLALEPIIYLRLARTRDYLDDIDSEVSLWRESQSKSP